MLGIAEREHAATQDQPSPTFDALALVQFIKTAR